MSHYPVLVVGENWESQLEPFDENLEVEFKDETDEYKNQYENDSQEHVKLPNGKTYLRWDNRFYNPNYKIFDLDDENNPKHIYPEGSEMVEIPYKEMYSTFAEFMSDWCGYTEHNGMYGYWHNPKAKWDWYQMGGRWRGFFPMKLTAEAMGKAKVGDAGAFGNEAKPQHADQLRIEDIDFEGADLEVAVEANKRFDVWEELINEFDPKHETVSWGIFCSRMNDESDPMTRDEAREEYSSQPLIKASKEHDDFKHWWGCLVEDIGFDREAYVNRRRESRFVTHAVLYNGEWYESGKMGWWGVVHDEKDEDTWNTQFHKLLNSLPSETLVTLVDCHI
jgi:hypothetical protein